MLSRFDAFLTGYLECVVVSCSQFVWGAGRALLWVVVHSMQKLMQIATEAELSTSAALGFRICGMQCMDLTSGDRINAPLT